MFLNDKFQSSNDQKLDHMAFLNFVLLSLICPLDFDINISCLALLKSDKYGTL
jgi:hypothetical protein